MRTPRITTTSAGAVLLAALALAACVPDSVEGQAGEGPAGLEGEATEDATPVADSDLSGQIAVSGSSTVQPVSALVAEDFQAQNQGVGITVDGPGTGDGFALFCEGRTDISNASREIKDEEAAICADNGIEYTELKVGIDGLSILTNPDNDAVGCVDLAALYALTGPESQGFSRWSEAAGLAGELGSTEPGEFPDVDLSLVGPGEESGTYDTYVELVIEEFNEDRGAEAATRSDYEASPNDNVIVQGIQGSATSLGWVGYAFFLENEGSLKALEVDGGDGCVAPTDDTIASGEYPLSRPLFIYVNDATAADNPALQAYVDYYLSDAGYAAVAEVGYVQLEQSEWDATRTAWAER